MNAPARVLLAAALLGAPLLGAANASGEPASLPPFLATLEVGAPGGRHDTAALGVAPDATMGYDVGQDAPEPPAPPGGAWVQAYVVDAERLTRSMLPPGAERAWSLRIDADGLAGDVALSWDPQGFAPIAATHGADLVVGQETIDLVNEPTLLLAKPDGRVGFPMTVRVAPLSGRAPSAPENLTATAGERAGDVVLRWSAPLDMGGNPLRRYVVLRAENEGAFEPIGATKALAFTDARRELGTASEYAVVAVTRLGESAPSATAFALGTAKLRALDAGEPADDERALVSAERDAPSTSVGSEPRRVDAIAIHGEPYAPDPSRYAVRLRVAGEEHEVVLFTGARIPIPLDAGLLDVPGASASTPGAAAGATVARREGALVLRTRAEAGGAGVADATALPLVP